MTATLEDNPDIVWQSTLDGRYDCKVVGTEDRYRGVLTVVDSQSDKELLKEEVGLSYGAIFGPDISDVMEWESKCIEVVDNQ